MRLAVRIVAGFLLLLGLLGAVVIHQLLLIGQLHATNRDLAGVDLAAVRASLEVAARLERLTELTEKLVLLRDRDYANALDRVRGEVGVEIAEIDALALSLLEQQALDALAASWRSYTVFAATAEPRVLSETPEDADGHFLRVALLELSQGLARFEITTRESTARRIESSAAAAGRAQRVAWVAALLGLGAAAVASTLITRSVARPLQALARATREVADGNFAHRVTATGSAETAALASDFNRMADRLRELERLKRDVVAGVSHDLKAPLASMQETTRLVLDGSPGPLTDSQRRLLDLNFESGERLRRMIGDLLDLGRLEARAVEFDLATLDLIEVCQATVAESESAIAQRRIEVSIDLPAASLPVRADRSLLTQALRNVFTNALQFGKPGGRVGVRAQAFRSGRQVKDAYPRWPGGTAPPYAAVEIWDDGPGVGDTDKERIFDRFHRAQKTHRRSQGTGLGLAIARAIVDGHGGEIWAEDQAPSGASFVLLLPLLTGPEAFEAAASDADAAPRRANYRRQAS